MEVLFQYVAPPSPCGYLPGQIWSLEYEIVASLMPAEYLARLKAGWRRFGHMLFRPRCPFCNACRSLRVVVERFHPNRSQRRTRTANENDIELRIGEPSVSATKLQLYDRYHAFQAKQKGWPEHPAKDADSYAHSFVENPIPTEEWCYYLEGNLVGVGYVDALPAGLSAIYFFHAPEHRSRGLGVWNILRLIEECQRRRLPHLYLGFYVADCPSLSYKANYAPNQILGPDGQWQDFQE